MSLEELSDLLVSVYRKERNISELLGFFNKISKENPLEILVEAYRVSTKALENRTNSLIKIAKHIKTENWKKPGDIIKYAIKIRSF